METVNDTHPPTDTPPYRRPGNRLTRSTDDKVVGGLAGGLGRYFGIDPVVFRIAFVVLTLAGGSGILLYLVGWLMIPDDAGGNAIQRFGGERHQKLIAAVLAGLGVLILLDNLWGDDDIPLGLALVGASVIDVPVRGGAGDVSFRPLTVEEVRTPYRLGAGELVLDLSDLDLQGRTVTIVASVAAGVLDVVVPNDVAVDVDAHVGAGELQLLGRHSEGLDVGRTVSDPGRETAGRLILRARAGIGLVEVHRAFS